MTSRNLIGEHTAWTSWTSTCGRFEYKLTCHCGWFIGSDYIGLSQAQTFVEECRRAHRKHVKREAVS